MDGHYLHDKNIDKGKKQVVFRPKIQTGGYYEVRLAYTAGGNRASNVPVTVVHQDGQAKVIVNQSQPPPIDGLFTSLGTFRFEADNQSSVTISNEETDGHVIVDAVQFLARDSGESFHEPLGGELLTQAIREASLFAQREDLQSSSQRAMT